jgi:hypothetical protein
VLAPGALDIVPLYTRFAALRLEGGRREAEDVADERCRVLIRRLTSDAERYQRPFDRGHAENTSFEYPLFVPNARGAMAPHALVVLHGLNESYFQKLFPWAYAYTAHTGWPSLIFPMSFYVNRRPSRVFTEGRIFMKQYRQRRELPGNRFASPFNAVRSQRIAEHPARMASELLQSYHDLRQLAAAAREGRVPPLPRGTVLHFLGYSLGGYLAAMLLGADDTGLFAGSRAVLFASGGPIRARAAEERIDPRSLLILDEIAADRLAAFFGALAAETRGVSTLAEAREGSAARPDADTALARVVPCLESETDFAALGIALEMLDPTADGAAAARLARVASRLAVVVDENDTVIPAAGIRASVGRFVPAVTSLDLGNHEYPFNLSERLHDDFARVRSEAPEQWERLTACLQGPAAIAPRFAEAFGRLIEVTAAHGATP